MSKYDRERERKLDQRFPERYLWDAAKQRAQKFGVVFDIDIEDIKIPILCPILDVPLDTIRSGQRKYGPSLDRKDSSKGYIKGNVFVISWQANKYKSDMSIQDIRKLYDYISS